MKNFLLLAFLFILSIQAFSQGYITEIDYDQPSTDNAEFIEVFLPTGELPADYSIELYNGSNGDLYRTINLTDVDVSCTAGTGGQICLWDPAGSDNIQNGAPDGLALIESGVIVQAFSYEGTFTPDEGVANGTSLSNIGVSDTNNSPNASLLDEDGDGVFVVNNTPTPGVILPIELISFNAILKENSTLIFWTTSSELSNDYIAIEHSTDSKKFQEIGIVQGAGTTYEVQNYSFVDESPAAGMNYYRLRQVDYDGTISYSEVVSVEFVRDETTIIVYPNPTTDVLTVKFPANWEGETTITILNGLGQVVKVINTPTDTFSVSDLPIGMYNLRVTNGHQSVSKFFVKG